MAYQQNPNYAFQAGYPPPQGYPAQYGSPQPPPQGYPPPQQQQQYHYPPPQHYPQQQQQYQQYPPLQPGGYPPPQQPQYSPQYPPQHQYPPQQYPPPQQFPIVHRNTGYVSPQPQPQPQMYGQPSYLHPAQTAPPPGHPHHPFNHSHTLPPQGSPHHQPPPPIFHTSPPIAPLIVPTAQINDIYKACKGFGTDELALIRVFANSDGPTLDAIRAQYPTRTQRDLIATLEKETSGHFRTALKAVAFGPAESETFFAYLSITGIGTTEAMLTECIMGKTNAELMSMKTLYPQRYNESLEKAVRGDLSMKTEKMFEMALEARRMEDHDLVAPQAVTTDVEALFKATKGFGTDELAVCTVFTRSSDAHLRAVAAEYQRTHGTELAKMVRREFLGHMHDALLYILEGAMNKVARDVRLLEDSMKGLGTRDDLLITRLVRARWNRAHFEQVKVMYRAQYGRDLKARVKGETSGDYGRLMVALCE